MRKLTEEPMKTRTITFALTAIIVIGILSYCGKNPLAGNGTQTGNPVASMLYNPGGSPAKNAKVIFYPVNYNPRTGGLGKTASAGSVDSTTTDNNGNYDITLDTGTYNVLANGDSGLAFQDSITVIKGDTIKPPADTLRPAGTIQGIVQMQPGDDARTVFILFMGTHTFTMPTDSIGNFTSDDMAAGHYSVRIITTTPNYKVLDTNLSVIAGTANVLTQSIVLQYTGIPIPEGLKINYDTLKQIVNLLWNKPANGRKVQSYTVYRKRSDSASFVSIKAGVTDTVYSDSTGVQDMTYEYRVAVMDTNSTEGVKSSGIMVVIATCFRVDSLVGGYGTGPGQFENLTGMAVDRSGNLYIADGSMNRIQVFNSNMAYQFEIDSPNVIFPNGLVVDSSGNIYSVVTRSSNMIKVFNPSGTLTDSIVVGTGGLGQIGDICIHNNELFLVFRYDSAFTFNDSVIVMGLDGTVKRSWPVTGGPGYISVNSSNNVFITETNSIQIYDTLGNFKSSIAPTGFSPNAKVAFDSKERLIVDQNGSDLWFFDTLGNFISKYNLQNYMPVGENIGGGICTVNIAGKDFIYVEVLGGAATKIIKLSNMLP
jgi:hypothetical protein